MPSPRNYLSNTKSISYKHKNTR